MNRLSFGKKRITGRIINNLSLQKKRITTIKSMLVVAAFAQLLDVIHALLLLKQSFVSLWDIGKKSPGFQLDERIFCMDAMKLFRIQEIEEANK